MYPIVCGGRCTLNADRSNHRAWHSIKFLDPRESGAVIPVLHVNGFKISERTIFGCMDDKELVCLFTGYGYQVSIVENLAQIDDELSSSLKWALSEIRKIQKSARSGEPMEKPRWPMIILRTPKASPLIVRLAFVGALLILRHQGWTGPKMVDGKIIEGSFHSHQVPLPMANKDEAQLRILDEWLSSYRIAELLPNGRPNEQILDIIPNDDGSKLGQNRASYDPPIGLDLPKWEDFAVAKGGDESCMKALGRFLAQVLQDNPSGVRIFSPDELESNKLDAVLYHTGRNFQWDEFSRVSGGRVVELLSEHCCQGYLQGYTLTGRVGIFPSYESFLGIVHTMMIQYSKFMKIAHEVRWRGDLPSIKYATSSPMCFPSASFPLLTPRCPATSRPVRGRDRSTTAFRTRTRLSSGRF